MMTTAIDRNVAEIYLVRIINTIGKAGIRTMSDLRAVPALYDQYITALHTWLVSVGFATNACASIIRAHSVSAEDMAGDLLARWMNPNRRPCRTKSRTEQETLRAALHPAMDYVLDMAVTRDASAVIRYLMRATYNFCVEKFRESREEMEKTVQSDPDTLRHSDMNAQDAGAMKKHPSAAYASEGEILRRERMAAAFSCFDNDFLHDVSILGDALGVQRQALADVIYSGRSYALACQMVKRINAMLGGDYTDAFAPFLKAARSFRLPEKFRTDMSALMRRLYRATNSDSRQAMKTRIVSAIA
ncbi:MAG: hypothetical protein IJE07_14335 [Clostridia bacterium]|nr:hypothetical protein [Clostridia bacterium]